MHACLTYMGIYSAAGRQLLQALRVPLRHDMYVSAAGMYTIWAGGKVVFWVCRMANAADLSGAHLHPISYVSLHATEVCSRNCTCQWRCPF